VFVATLLTDPARAGLDAVLVEALRNAWGGGEARWLNPGVAAEFDLPLVPANRWDIWADLQLQGVDLAVQRAEGRRKRLLIADMDSTMIGQECIDEMADVAGFGAQVAVITEQAMNGLLEFEPALRARVALFRGMDAGIVDRVLAERITYTQGGRELVATMKAHGAYTALVSGGFTAFTQRVAGELGFDEHRANRLEVAGSCLAGTVEEPVLGRQAKIDALVEISARLGFPPEAAMAVGDGANDLGMLGLAGAGVALHAKPVVAERCELRVNHGDLTALLYLQGYSVDDFST
jgi:phosphoserine phosphatase